MKNNIAFLLVGLVCLALFSCSKNDSQTTTGKAHLNIKLTDDPGNYDAVNIDVRQIEVHYASADSADASSGWETISLLNPGVYNLLDFSNGLDTLLASVDIPAGKISQIRMILGDNNSVVIDSVSHALTTPSAQESGLKFNLDQTLDAGLSYVLYIDFDAGRSVVEAGQSNKFLLKPVIRAYAQNYGGTIKGVVLPEVARPYVLAIMNEDTLSAKPDASGAYLLSGLAEGNWQLYFSAADSSYQSQEVPDINVTTGNISTVDTVRLHQ